LDRFFRFFAGFCTRISKKRGCGIVRTLLMLRFKSSETADPSAETVPEICRKSRKTRSRVFGPNPHCTVHFGGAAPRPPMFCGIVRTLLMLRFKNAKSQFLVRKILPKNPRHLPKIPRDLPKSS